jgi:hypothetical protein
LFAKKSEEKSHLHLQSSQEDNKRKNTTTTDEKSVKLGLAEGGRKIWHLQSTIAETSDLESQLATENTVMKTLLLGRRLSDENAVRVAARITRGI